MQEDPKPKDEKTEKETAIHQFHHFTLSALQFLLTEYRNGVHPQDRDVVAAQAHYPPNMPLPGGPSHAEPGRARATGQASASTASSADRSGASRCAAAWRAAASERPASGSVISM